MPSPILICRKTVAISAILALLFVFTIRTAVADNIPLLAQQTAPRTVLLTWSDNAGAVTISRQFQDDPQPVVLTSTSLSSWTDVHHRAVCDDSVRYFITNGTDSGYAAVFVSDNEPTSPAEWGVVTMDHTLSQIVLTWNPSADTDIMGYLICEGTPSIAIDTVFGRLNTQYLYRHEDSIIVHQFRICAFDSCLQASALTSLCNNMALILQNEPCSQTVVATWNRYFNMPSGLGSYELWVSENDAPFQCRQVIEAEGSTTATFTVAEGCTMLRTYVRAISSDGTQTALSNLVTIDFATAGRPEYLYLRRVSVDDDNACVQIQGSTQPGWNNAEFKIYRATAGGTPAIVGSCHPDSQGELLWQDHNAHYNQSVYTYLFAVTDACGRNEMRSSAASTILPTVDGSGNVTTISWNPYQGWEGTTTYCVYSSSPSHPQWQPIAVTAASSVTVTYDQPLGLCNYKVDAIEGPDSRYRRNDTAQSATVAYCPPTDIWMPNAFTPTESTNNTFGPHSLFINPDGYAFHIFNRHGTLIFSTTDPAQQWDGYSNGQLQPAGSYVYTITFRQSNGAERQLTGSFLLVY